MGADTRSRADLLAEIASLERRLADTELKTCELYLRRMVLDSPDGLVLADNEGVVRVWTPGMARITGIEMANAMGQPLWNVLAELAPEYARGPETREQIRANTMALLTAQAQDWTFRSEEQEILLATGARRTIRVLTCPIRSGDGWVVASLVTDVSEQKGRRATIQDALDRLNTLERVVDNGPAVVIVWHPEPDSAVEYISGSVRYMGYEPEDFTSGRITLDGITHPEDLPHFKRALARHAEQGIDDFATHYRVYDRSGEVHHIDVQTRAVRNRQGRIAHYHSVAFDSAEYGRLLGHGVPQDVPAQFPPHGEPLPGVVDAARSQRGRALASGANPLRMCAACKKVVGEGGQWEDIATFLVKRYGLFVTHGICPECLERLYGDLADGLDALRVE